jgi:hypothetical protein
MQNGQNLPRHFDVILGHVDRFETDQKALTPAPAGTAAPTGPATALASPGTSQTELIRVFYAVLYPDFTHTGGILANCRDVEGMSSLDKPKAKLTSHCPLLSWVWTIESTQKKASGLWIDLVPVALLLLCKTNEWGFGHSGGQLSPIWTDGGLALLLSGSPGQMGGQSRPAAVFCPTSQILSGGAKSTRERYPLSREDSSREPPVRRSCT